jgi:hypothetical protein
MNPWGPAARQCGEFSGQAERKKSGDGVRTHGGQIAESPGQGTMADGFGRMPIKAEMAACDGEVGGDS